MLDSRNLTHLLGCVKRKLGNKKKKEKKNQINDLPIKRERKKNVLMMMCQ